MRPFSSFLRSLILTIEIERELIGDRQEHISMEWCKASEQKDSRSKTLFGENEALRHQNEQTPTTQPAIMKFLELGAIWCNRV